MFEFLNNLPGAKPMPQGVQGIVPAQPGMTSVVPNAAPAPEDATGKFLKSMNGAGAGQTDYQALLAAIMQQSAPKALLAESQGDFGKRLAKMGSDMVNNSKGKNVISALADASANDDDAVKKDAQTLDAQRRDALKTITDTYGKDRTFGLEKDKFGFEKDKTAKEQAMKEKEFGLDSEYKHGMLGNAAGQLNLARDKMGQTDATAMMDYMVSSGIAKDKKEAYGLYAKMHQTAGASGYDPETKAVLSLYEKSVGSALTPAGVISPDKARATIRELTHSGDLPAATGLPATISNKAQYDSLPSGSVYIDSKTGNKKVKQ